MSGASRNPHRKPPRRSKRRREATPPAKDKPPAKPSTTTNKLRLFVLVALGVVLIGSAVLVRNTIRSNPRLRIPTIETKDLSNEVAKEIHRTMEAIVAQPDSGDTWGEYGLVLFAHGFRKEAGDCFREAEKLDPGEYRWPYYLGMTMAVWDTQESLTAFERAVEKSPQRLSVRLRLAEWHFDLRKFEPCERHVRMALNQDPQSQRAQLMMARLEFERGQFDAALEWARRSADSPQGARRDVHELLARIYQRLGDSDTAAHEVELAEQCPRGTIVWNDPEMGRAAQHARDATILNTQAQLEMMHGNVNRRLAKLRQVVEYEPNNVLWKERLAEALIQARQLAEAKQFLDQDALVQHPESSVLVFLQGRVEFESGDVEKARQAFQRAIAAKHDYDEAYAWLGKCHLSQGDAVAALRAIEEAVRLNPANIQAQEFLGQAWLAQHETDRAIQSLQRAVELTSHPGLRIQLAETLLVANQPDAAIQQLRAAEKQGPNDQIPPLLQRAQRLQASMGPKQGGGSPEASGQEQSGSAVGPVKEPSKTSPGAAEK